MGCSARKPVNQLIIEEDQYKWKIIQKESVRKKQPWPSWSKSIAEKSTTATRMNATSAVICWRMRTTGLIAARMERINRLVQPVPFIVILLNTGEKLRQSCDLQALG